MIPTKKHIQFNISDVGDAEIAAVSDVLRSTWITTGAKTKLLEEKLARYLGTARCVCLGSQTACAEMVLRLLGVGHGDEVIVPAYTYTASASVVDHVGAKIVMVDSQKDDFAMDYDALEAAITEKTKVIIPVDLGGIPCDYDRIFDIVERKKHLFKPASAIQETFGRIIVCADAAHALGASYHDKKVGGIADFSSFSFHAVKNFTTAEGGALTWRKIDGIDDDELYRRLQLLSLHGQSRDAFAKTQQGTWEYDVIGTWYKCNMTDVAAAMGLAQFERYPQMLERRREIIAKYDAAFKPLGVKVLEHRNRDYTSSAHLYITRISGITPCERNEIIDKMANEGVACNVHYKPLPMLTAYKELGFDIKDFPNAFSYYAGEITLPLYTCLSDDEVEYIIEKYTNIVKLYLKSGVKR